jgi:hypothetical protein
MLQKYSDLYNDLRTRSFSFTIRVQHHYRSSLGETNWDPHNCNMWFSRSLEIKIRRMNSMKFIVWESGCGWYVGAIWKQWALIPTTIYWSEFSQRATPKEIQSSSVSRRRGKHRFGKQSVIFFRRRKLNTIENFRLWMADKILKYLQLCPLVRVA